MDEEVIALAAVILMFGGPTVCYVIHRVMTMVENMGRVHLESKLKTTMIERGYSVQEIERLCATPLDATAAQQAMRPDAYPSAVGPQKPIRT
jgi:hypothetical protein